MMSIIRRESEHNKIYSIIRILKEYNIKYRIVVIPVERRKKTWEK